MVLLLSPFIDFITRFHIKEIYLEIVVNKLNFEDIVLEDIVMTNAFI